MKVGIITVHSVPNYGAVLQAYALARHLRRSGVDADTIDYRQPALEEMYRVRWRIPPPVKHWLRMRRSDDFVASRLPLSPFRCRSVEEFLPHAAAYDAFITGSDRQANANSGENAEPGEQRGNRFNRNRGRNRFRPRNNEGGDNREQPQPAEAAVKDPAE